MVKKVESLNKDFLSLKFHYFILFYCTNYVASLEELLLASEITQKDYSRKFSRKNTAPTSRNFF